MEKQEDTEVEIVNTRKIEGNFKNSLYIISNFVTNLSHEAVRQDEIAKRWVEEYRNELKSIIRDAPKKANFDNVPRPSEERIESVLSPILELLKTWDHGWINLYDNSGQNYQFLLRSCFMMLIAAFDYLISDILHHYYERYPDAIGDDTVISVAELRKCVDLEDAYQFLIDQKVESLLFKSFFKQIGFFETGLKIKIFDKIINWDLINEAYQRRNVLAHNNGVVNLRYLKNIIRTSEENNIKVGDRLEISKEYFTKVFQEILVGGIVLNQNCWRKWFKESIAEADSTLLDFLNKEFIRREFNIAEKTCLFCKEINIGKTKEIIDLNIIYCGVLKKLGKESELVMEIENLKACNLDNMQLAEIAAIKEDKQAIYTNLKKAVENNEERGSDINWGVLFHDILSDEECLRQVELILKRKISLY